MSTLYQPLKRWQTRLLRLHLTTSVSDDGLLTADLLKVNQVYLPGAVLSDGETHVEYEALSYTWGSGRLDREVTVNGIAVKITTNLFEFLRQYRRRHSVGDVTTEAATLLWIDALCINQADDEEKSWHVMRMLAIYQKATKVIVWLGIEHDGTAEALAWLDQSNQHYESLTVLRKRSIFSKDDCDAPKAESGGLQAEFGTMQGGWLHTASANPGPLEAAETALLGLQDLCTRPWLLRIWVRQEVWAASVISMWCGRSTFSWNLFQRLLEAYSQASEQSARDYDSNDALVSAIRRGFVAAASHVSGKPIVLDRRIQAAGRGLQQRAQIAKVELLHAAAARGYEFGGASQKTLLELWQEAASCQCSDPRDIIFALVGMSSDLGIEVDYSKSITQIYTDFAIYVARELDGVTPLLFRVDRENVQPALAALPSWVPDWTNARVPMRQAEMQEAFFRREADNLLGSKANVYPRRWWLSRHDAYYDLGDTTHRTRPGMEQLLDGGVLNAVGFVIGSLTTAASTSQGALQPASGDRSTMLYWQHGSIGGEPGVRGYRSSAFRTTTSNLRAPKRAEPGDVLACVDHCNLPLVLRRQDIPAVGEPSYLYIGPCVFHDSARDSVARSGSTPPDVSFTDPLDVAWENLRHVLRRYEYAHNHELEAIRIV